MAVFPQFTSAMTIAAWMRRPGSALNYGDAIVNASFGEWSAFYLRITHYTYDYYEFRIKTTGGHLSTAQYRPPTPEQWHRIIGVYDRSEASQQRLKIYVDSVLVATTQIAPFNDYDEDIAEQSSETFLGKCVDANSLDIDDVCVWNQALTQEEVTADYAGTPPSSGLVGRWSCDDNSSSKVVLDSSGNSLNGWATVDTDQLYIADCQEGTGAFRGSITKYVQFSYIEQKTLTISADTGGSITAPTESPVQYDVDEVVPITAVADEGYQFVEWTGDIENIADPSLADTTITMNDDATIVATFELIPITQCTLTISSTDGGDVTTPGEGNYAYDAETVVPIVATADTHYHFVNWTGTTVTAGKVAAPTSASTTVTVSDDYTLIANFAIDIFTLTYTAGEHGSISGISPQTVNYGEDGSAVEAVPMTVGFVSRSAHYHFVDWSDGSTKNPRTDTNVTSDISVTANFAKNASDGSDIKRKPITRRAKLDDKMTKKAHRENMASLAQNPAKASPFRQLWYHVGGKRKR